MRRSVLFMRKYRPLVIILPFLLLLFSPSFSLADEIPSYVFGTWSGSFKPDTMYWNIGQGWVCDGIDWEDQIAEYFWEEGAWVSSWHDVIIGEDDIGDPVWSLEQVPWNPDYLFDGNAPSPNNPLSFTLVLHEHDGDSYGFLTMSEPWMGGYVRNLWEDGGIEIVLDETNDLIMTMQFLDQEDKPWFYSGYVLSGEYWEYPYPPPPGYLTAEGTVEMHKVPIPPTILLLCSGLIGLAGLKRKFTRS